MTSDDRTDQAHADTVAVSSAETVAAPSTGASSAQPRPVAVGSAALDAMGYGDRYSHDRQLGRGGMGEVWLADDLRIGRQVAVKTLRDHARGDQGSLVRFLREARVQGQLEHPAIVPVYDLGAAPDGTPFFTMKRLRGMTLEQLLARIAGDNEAARTHSLRKLLAGFAQVCQAVHFAHTRGVIHRDLKPANIMLGDFGEVYVLDWGVARLAGVPDDPALSAVTPAVRDSGVTTGPGDSSRTAYGSVIGTPGYMAPEQLRGETDQVDARSDVYALGAMLFEILTLQPLHDHSSSESMARSTLDGADARATARAPDRDVAPELEAICVRATALDPADRYPTAADLVADLERYLDGDRDLERRRQLAAEHATIAAHACEQAHAAGSEEVRKRALREAGRALALDPGNAQAIGVMTRLFLEPPPTMPAEVEAEHAHITEQAAKREARMSAGMYIVQLCFAPIYLWAGITNWGWVGAMFALIVALCAQGWYVGTRGTPTPGQVHVALLLNTILVAIVARTFGPFIIVPAVAALGTAAFVFQSRYVRFEVVVAAGAAAVLAPVLLEELGWLASTYSFHDDMLLVRSHLIHLPPTPALLGLALSSVAVVGAGAVMIGRIRRAQITAERRLLLQAWQLRQLVPEQTLLDSPR